MAASVHSAAEVDEASWSIDERCQEVGGEHIDGEQVRVSVDGFDAARFAVPDPRVVNDRVEVSECVGLPGDLVDLVGAAEVPEDDGYVSIERPARVGRALCRPGVEDDVVTFGEELSRGCEAEAIAGSGDEDSCHASTFTIR